MLVWFILVFVVSSFRGFECPRPLRPNQTAPIFPRIRQSSFESGEIGENQCEAVYFERMMSGDISGNHPSKTKKSRQFQSQPSPDEDNLQFRISEGENAKDKDAPYTIIYGRICSGTAIHQWWAITSAHCGPFESFVYAGSATFILNREFSICAHYLHPKFKSPEKGHPKDYDIQLLMMEQPFPINIVGDLYISPIPLHKPKELPMTTLTGWGASKGGVIPRVVDKVMRKAEVPFMPDDTCRTFMSKNAEYNITRRMACIGYPNGPHKSGCYGDSGGPAVTSSGLVGIIAFGIDCGQQGPTVIMLVTDDEIRSWIRTVTQQLWL